MTIPEYATESSDGTRLFTCTKCDDSYTQTIPATGHRWGPWVVDLEPTCTTPGHEYRACEQYPDNPHYEEREIAPLSATGDHLYVLGEERQSTCTEWGYRLHVCSLCGDSYQEDVQPVSHEWGPWLVEQEPTGTQEGQSKRVCLHDETHVEYKAIPVLEKSEEQTPVAKALERTEPPEPPAAPPEAPNLFLSGPNAFDAVVLTMDLAALLLFLILMIPLVHQMTWIKRKRAEARRNFITHIHEGK